MTDFEESDKFFTNVQTISWLRIYLRYLENFPIKPRTEKEFVETLKYHFLRVPGMDIFTPDIAFNKDETKIEAARFYVQSKW